MSSIPSPADMASSASSTTSSSSLSIANKKSRISSCLPGIPTRWFFPSEKLISQNPSLRSGIDLEKELSYRQQAASFIHDLGTRLQLPHWVMNVAIVYMHRFYVFHSFKRFHRNDLAAAALFLAAKVEEMPRKLEHIVKIAYALQHRDEPTLDSMSDKYFEEAQKIATYENILLQTLGFDLNVEVPNTFVVKRIQALNAPRSLAFAAYHFTTDSLHLTTFCVRYRPSVVACACIYLACEWAKWEIPAMRDGKPWYIHLDPEVTPELLKALADELVSVFQRCNERIRSKRHLASIKRDSNGVVIPSSVMSDRNNGVSLADLHNYVSSSHSIPTPPPPPPTLPTISFPPASVKIDIKMANEKLSIGASFDGATTDSGHGSISFNVTSANGTASTAPSSAEKKPRPETSKVDLKSYKERMKERGLEKPKNGSDGNEQAPPRKSFIPDMSSMGKDSWLFASGDKNEESKDLKSTLPKDMLSESTSKDRHHERRDEETRDRRSRQDDHNRHHRSHHSHSRRDEKSKSDRLSSSAERSNSQREKDHRPREPAIEHRQPPPVSLTEAPLKSPQSSHRHRSQPSQQEQSKTAENGTTESASRERPFSRTDYSLSSASSDCPDSATPSKKRRHEESQEENGTVHKTARVIDYEHGARGGQRPKTIIDYDFGTRIVADYKHGAASVTELGYDETKALASILVSTLAAGLINGTDSHGDDEKKTEENGKLPSSSQQEKPIPSGSRHSDGGRYQPYSKPRQERPQPCPQTAVIDRHFHSIGMQLSHSLTGKGQSSSHSDTTNGYSAGSTKNDGVPDDDILRQAARKAEQIQKAEPSYKKERLEKLKNTNFGAIPLLSMKVSKPPNMPNGDGWARNRQDDPP